MTSPAARPRWWGLLALLWLLQAGGASAQAPATLSGKTVNLTVTGVPTPYSIEFGASIFTLRVNGSIAQSGTYTYAPLSGTQGRAVLTTTAPAEDAGSVDTITLTFGTAISGTFVDNFVGNDSTVESYSGTFTMVEGVVFRPTITTQPRSQSVTAGDNVTLSVSATGSGPLTYQWFKDSVAVNGATAASLPLSNMTTAQTGQYHVEVANAGGVTPSWSAFVITLPAAGGTFAGSDNFNDNSRDTARWGTADFAPSGTLVEANGRLEFRKSTTNDFGGGWGWHSSLAPYAQDWEARVTVNVPALSFTADGYATLGIFVFHSADPGDQVGVELETGRYLGSPYRNFLSTVATNDVGLDSDVSANTTSTTATLRVRWVAATARMHLEYDVDGPANGDVWTVLRTFDPAVTWGMSSGSFLVGIFGGSDNRIIASGDGLSLDDFVASTTAGGTAPGITTQPQSQVASATSNVTFTVAATGSGLTYQWRKGGADLSGETSATLTLNNVTRATSGAYSVVVTSGGSSTPSSTATLRVIVPQQLSSQRGGGGQFQLLFADPDGGLGSDLSRFEVHHTMNFLGASTVWVTNSGSFTLNNGKILFDDTGSVGPARRFYRVIEK